MKLTFFILGMIFLLTSGALAQEPLGLPPVPVPKDNPITPDKVALGKRLFMDKRFSADGTVACATCHDPQMAFVDGLPVSEGINGRKGVRNAPTVINAAYYTSQFWDGRRPSLEEQAKDPFVNPVEHGLPNHEPILQVVRSDKEYVKAFRKVFGLEPEQITIDHVVKAIAAFERTIIAGDSPFDRYYYGGEEDAISEAAKRGFKLYQTKARCQDCHRIDQNFALFTDNKFHNLGVGMDKIAPKLRKLITSYRKAKRQGQDVEKLFSKEEISELGRFAVTLKLSDVGAFKTPSLRNVAVTGPYMHNGELETLEEVVEFYNQGGHKNPFLASGIRPLNLTDQEKKDLVEFLKTLTSPEYQELQK